MDRDKILKIADELSQNTLSCSLEYINKLNIFDGVNLNGENITVVQLENYFDDYKLGINCVIKKIVFQPKNKNFLIAITDGSITCSKYADMTEADEVINEVNRLLQ